MTGEQRMTGAQRMTDEQKMTSVQMQSSISASVRWQLVQHSFAADRGQSYAKQWTGNYLKYNVQKIFSLT